MIYNVSPGDILPLSVQIGNYDPAKYVRAYLFDDELNPLSDSPVDLSAEGTEGMYVANTVEMPDSDYVIAQYLVYDDAGYTTLSTSQGGNSDTFLLNGVSFGDTLPLALQLFNYDPNMYPQAVVRDANNAAVGSPVNLSPVGLYGLYFGTISAPDSIFAIAQFIVYDDSGHTEVSGLQGGTSDTFFFLTNAPFNYGNVPNVEDALQDWFQPMVFNVISTSVKGFEAAETAHVAKFRGVIQPHPAQKLEMAPQGQRQWKWWMLHAQPSLVLFPDDRVKYLSNWYRVMEKLDYSRYGYVQYSLIEDYQ